MQLYDGQPYETESNNKKLEGDDTKTVVTIIDDDKPGMFEFEEEKEICIKVSDKEFDSNDNYFFKILVIRYNGSDGPASVDFTAIEYSAITDVDFEISSGWGS